MRLTSQQLTSRGRRHSAVKRSVTHGLLSNEKESPIAAPAEAVWLVERETITPNLPPADIVYV